MTKEKWLSVIRHMLSAIGGIVIAYGFMGESITQEIIGAAMAVIGLVWSLKDKSSSLGMVEGTIRQVLTLAGGFLAAKSIISPNMVEAIISTIVTMLPIILGQTDKAWDQPKADPVVEPEA